MFISGKVVAGSDPKPRNSWLGLFCAAGLAGTALLSSGCATLEKRREERSRVEAILFAEENRRNISLEVHALRTTEYDYFGEPLDGQQVILEVPPGLQVDRLEYLANDYVVSLAAADLPRDVARYLQAARQADGRSFFDYVLDYVDRIILCPHYTSKSGAWIALPSLLGVTDMNYYAYWPYRGERLIFLVTKSLREGDASLRNYVSTIVHEAAHKELSKLVQDELVHPAYLGVIRNNVPDFALNERYASLKQREFIQAVIRDLDYSFAWQGQLSSVEARINEYNAQLGLKQDDFDLHFDYWDGHDFN
ncbi:hypothetical protein NO2_0216 [Candidatus Termititenax persephonae]|uniref:Uncharacterized protein n=1 Tax=Candidatus Termititenax persephonae TaxID=2218525 RepID=A0A388TH10_9BACT|nr:hypothetical protein NO2_0216 [Candidatus Termititenax persephonae]